MQNLIRTVPAFILGLFLFAVPACGPKDESASEREAMARGLGSGVAATVTRITTAIDTATGTSTRTLPITQTGTDTGTVTTTSLVTVTQTATGTETGWGTTTWSGTQTSTATSTATGTQTGTTGQTATGTVTETHTQTLTMVQTLTNVQTNTITRTQTQTNTATRTNTNTNTVTNSATGTVTVTNSATGTQTATRTYTASRTNSGTVSGLWTFTASGTQTLQLQSSNTGTSVVTSNQQWGPGSATVTGLRANVTLTGTDSASNTAAYTGSESGTATASWTQPLNGINYTWTSTSNNTSARVVTGTGTWTYTQNRNLQPAWTGSATFTRTGTATGYNTSTGTSTAIRTSTGTATGTSTGTASGTETLTASGTATSETTSTATGTGTGSFTDTNTGTTTQTLTATNTVTHTSTFTATVTNTNSATNSSTATRTTTLTRTNTSTATNTTTATNTVTNTVTTTRTATSVNTFTVTTTGTSTSTNDITVIMAFPKGLGFESIPVAANGYVQLGDRSKTRTAEDLPSPLSNAGSGWTDIGVEGKVGTVTSIGSVALRRRAQVTGDVVTGGDLAKQTDGFVSGAEAKNAELTPLAISGWDVEIPAANQGDILLSAGATVAIEPGAYGQISVTSGAKLSLRSGVYFATSFNVDAQGSVTLDMPMGSIFVYVTGGINCKGPIATSAFNNGVFMLVGLGTSDVFVEHAFSGTIVAPNATLTLGSTVPLTLTGGFYAKNLVVRPDTTLVAAPFPWSTMLNDASDYCGPLDSDNDGVGDRCDKCPYDPNKTDPGICDCFRSDVDSDGDKVPDCLDGTRHDFNTTSVGQCGSTDYSGYASAGQPCTDSLCPQSNPVCDGAGICGSKADCSPSGANPSQVITAGGKAYWLVGVPTPEGRSTGAAAEASCRAKGMTLLRISSARENEYLTSLITSPVWLGANALTTAGEWHWATPTTNDGDKFWIGGPDGANANSLYANWASNAPGSNRCAVLSNVDGRWHDTDCAANLGYVCEYSMPMPKVELQRPPVAQFAEPMTNCVPASAAIAQLPTPAGNPPSDAASFAAQEELKRQIAATADGGFTGAAANPPEAGARCTVLDKNAFSIGSGDYAGCEFKDLNDPNDTDPNSAGCATNADCAPFGADHVCRVLPNPGCDPKTNPAMCRGHGWCGVLDCSNLLGQESESCDEINICDPNSEVDAGLDPNAIPQPILEFDPNSLFAGGSPPDARGAPFYEDPPPPVGVDAGVNHPWCKFKTQNPNSVASAQQTLPPPAVKTKNNQKISLSLDPELTFKIDPKPLALGESNMTLLAEAGVKASVKLNDFLGQTLDKVILEGKASIEGQRCDFRTSGTRLQVLEQYIDLTKFGVPIFNTADPSNPVNKYTKGCTQAVARFQEAAGRAKKAFRDAQQFLNQYHTLRKSGKLLTVDGLCQVLNAMPADVPGFPQGARCYANETVESLINRFVYYYQGPGSGQITQLTNAVGHLSTMTAEVKEKFMAWIGEWAVKHLGSKPPENWKQPFKPLQIDMNFLNRSHQESRTIMSVQFAIGPVPCVLQVDLATSYGITGKFGLELGIPTNLTATPPTEPATLAHVSASVVPHANAVLSAFVGAGFDYAAFSATIGIEGALNLATLRAPLVAGAGLKVQALEDVRGLPLDVQPPVSVAADAVGLNFHFGIPKSFRFIAYYDYGLSIDIEDVLKGEINARLRIKFAFFSRTWRTRLLKFNGFQFHFDLLKGSKSADFTIGKQTAPSTGNNAESEVSVGTSENTTAGLSQSEVPLAVLAPLRENPPSGPLPREDGTPWDPQEVDLSSLQSPLYDNLCCAKAGESCGTDGSKPPCCANLLCVDDYCTSTSYFKGCNSTGMAMCDDIVDKTYYSNHTGQPGCQKSTDCKGQYEFCLDPPCPAPVGNEIPNIKVKAEGTPTDGARIEIVTANSSGGGGSHSDVKIAPWDELTTGIGVHADANAAATVFCAKNASLTRAISEIRVRWTDDSSEIFPCGGSTCTIGLSAKNGFVATCHFVAIP